MSLLEAMTEDFVILDKSSVEDGEGGFESVWSEGATIKAILTLDTSMQAKRAEREGVTSVYTLTTAKDVVLEFHTVVKRLKDNSIFRVTTEGGEKVTPSVSTLNMTQVSAEKWELPT